MASQNSINQDAVMEERAKKSEKKYSRREFLNKGISVAGWGIIVTTVGVGLYEGLRFLCPSVVFHPPSKYVIGQVKDFLVDKRPDQYGVIFVDNKFKKAHRFFVIREKNRIYALFARCTHLGCTVNWFEDLNIFKCPCHGSEFHSDGVEFAGPAPRPLDRHHITLDSSGNLIVDTALVYTQEEFEKQKVFVEVA